MSNLIFFVVGMAVGYPLKPTLSKFVKPLLSKLIAWVISKWFSQKA